MIQIFILGSSTVYGVGSTDGGWADLLKRILHERMYAKGGVGQNYEIYNFGKSGATVDFVICTFPKQLAEYGRGGKIITIVSVGGNNAKAEDKPDNYVSTIEEYSAQMEELLNLLQEKSEHVVVVGGGFYDESKTYPNQNPFTGGKSYFSNKRHQTFQKRLKNICKEKGVMFVDLGVDEKTWKNRYLFIDGLHPNQKGHELICTKVLQEIAKLL